MITLQNPEAEKRRQLLLRLQYHSAQMSEADQLRLLATMQRARLLNRVWPGLGGKYLRLELRLALARA